MSSFRTVAELMEVAARTAPKARGQDYVVTAILEGEQLDQLAVKMAEIGERTGRQFLIRDSKNVQASEAVVLIGIKDGATAGLDCGACGKATCSELETNTLDADFQGPQCAYRLLDMGIALGSAAKMAGMLNMDNRIMYTIGVAARDLGLLDADFLMGIPLSASAKSIYFDRA
jgi:uncharacterized ferredoxin-like protein